MTYHIILNSTHLTKKKGNKDLNREDAMEKVNGYAVQSAETKQDYRYGQTQKFKNFPLYCPKCKQESLINAKDLQVTVIKRIEAKMQDFKQ